MNFSIGTKLGILLSFLGIFFIGITGYYAYNQSRMLLINAAEEKLFTANQVLAQRFSNSIDSIKKTVLFLTSLNILKESVLNEQVKLSDEFSDNARFLTDIFSNIMSSYPEFSQIRYIDANNYGKELLRVDRVENGIKVIEKNLQEKNHYPYVYKTLKLSAGQIYLSNINFNREYGTHLAEGKPTIRIASPVTSRKGKTIGVIVINVDLYNLFFLLSYELPESIQAVLTNQAGDYLIHPDPDKVFGFEKGRRMLIQDDIQSISSFYEGKGKQLILDTNIGPQAKHRFVSTFLKIPFGYQKDNRFLVLGLITSTERVLEGSQILGRDIINLIILFSILSILISLFLSRILAKPVHDMAISVRNYETGKRLIDLPTGRKDEIGFLARNFSILTQQINQQIDSLEKNRTILLNNEKQLSEAQHIAKLASWEWHSMSDKLSVSKELEDIIGKKLYDLESLFQIIRPDVRVRVKQEFAQAFKYKHRFHITYQIMNLNEEIRHLRMLGEIVYDGDGAPIGMLGSIQDVTREQTYIDQLQDLRLVAEKANQSKSEFLANMSHELRTPLHAILSFAQFGLTRKENITKDKLSSYFQMIQTSGERLLELLNGLLDISKLEAGKLEINFIRKNFLEVVDDCLKEQQSLFLERKLKIQFNHSEAFCFAEFDSLRIAQVISNLIANAINASIKGHAIYIDVQCRQTMDDNEVLLFSIRDEGVGIPEDETVTIFDKFVQSSKTITGTGGTGLGLAICRQIIVLHGGKIWADNAPDGGAIFFFSLPLERNERHQIGKNKSLQPVENKSFTLVGDKSHQLEEINGPRG